MLGQGTCSGSCLAVNLTSLCLCLQGGGIDRAGGNGWLPRALLALRPLSWLLTDWPGQERESHCNSEGPGQRKRRCGQQNNGPPQRCQHPNFQNLGICYLPWQKGLCRCDEIKDLEMGRFPGLSGWTPNVIIRVLIRGSEEEFRHVTKEARGWSDVRKGQESRNVAASRGWKRQETDSRRASKRHAAC